MHPQGKLPLREAGQADFSGDRRKAYMGDNFLDFVGVFCDNR